jgi:hypothetical protein
MAPTDYRRYRHDAAVEEVREAAKGLYAETGLRVMDALESPTPADGQQDATQPTTDETQAQPPRVQWRVSLYDPIAEEWAPGAAFSDRERALERLQQAQIHSPRWADDNTPVRRRLVRETTTWTVEEDASVQWDGTATGATHVIDWVLRNGGTATYTCTNTDRCATRDGDCSHYIRLRTPDSADSIDVGDRVVRSPDGQLRRMAAGAES